jgi:hypothetical protein
MKLNFKRHSTNQSKKSIAAKLFGVHTLEELLDLFKLRALHKSKDDNIPIPGVWLEDLKDRPEGAQGLHLLPATNVFGVHYSDGSKYIDYDKLPEDDEREKIFDGGLMNGSLTLITKYKPDGSSFRALDSVQKPTDIVIKRSRPAAPSP